MNQRAPLLIAVLLAAAGVAWYVARAEPLPAGKKSAAPSVAVSLAPTEVRDVAVRLELAGRTEAYETVTLKSRVDGQVQNLPFSPGQHVKQGELLLRLDPADYQARLSQAEATLAKSQAQAAKASADSERYVGLRSKGFVSDEKLAELRVTAAASASSAQADAAAVAVARLQLSYTRVTAPFAGIVGAKLVSPGATVKANDTVLAVVNRVRPLYVSFALPEKYLPQIQAAMRATKKGMKATIAVAGGEGNIEGEVSFIDNGVDVGTGTIQLKAVVPNERESLAPGQFVSVSLVLEQLKSVLTIPTEAVQQGSEGSFVFVVKEGVAEVRKLKLATTQKGLAVVTEGLTEGETVVTEGQLRLTPGAKVTAVKPVSTERKPR